jgi:hypothetical protein
MSEVRRRRLSSEPSLIPFSRYHLPPLPSTAILRLLASRLSSPQQARHPLKPSRSSTRHRPSSSMRLHPLYFPLFNSANPFQIGPSLLSTTLSSLSPDFSRLSPHHPTTRISSTPAFACLPTKTLLPLLSMTRTPTFCTAYTPTTPKFSPPSSHSSPPQRSAPNGSEASSTASSPPSEASLYDYSYSLRSLSLSNVVFVAPDYQAAPIPMFPSPISFSVYPVWPGRPTRCAFHII